MTKYLAEFIGTALLVFFGCGTTVAAAALLGSMGMLVPAFSTLTVAAAFGLGTAVLSLAFGKISGGHLNPVISLAFWVRRKMSVKDLLGYIIAQFAGGIAGAALLMVTVGGRTSLAANGYDTLSTFGCSMWIAAMIEALCTFMLIWVVLATREEKETAPQQAVYTGLATLVIYLFSYPFTGAGANPARSLGPAVFQEGDALSQVWLFIIAPVAGALIAAVLYTLMTRERKPKAKGKDETETAGEGEDAEALIGEEAQAAEAQESDEDTEPGEDTELREGAETSEDTELRESTADAADVSADPDAAASEETLLEGAQEPDIKKEPKAE